MVVITVVEDVVVWGVVDGLEECYFSRGKGLSGDYELVLP